MYVSDWMTKRVFTVSPEDSVSDAIRLMKENGIKHLPVLRDAKIKGIVSDLDIKEFRPTNDTTIDLYEVHYLLAKTRIKSIMKAKPITTTHDRPIEEAARIIYDNNIGCLPVMQQGRLVGIVSDRDVFNAMVDISGVRHGGHRITALMEDEIDPTRKLTDLIRDHGFRIQSVITSHIGVPEGQRRVVVRTRGQGDYKKMKSDLEKAYNNISIRKG